MVVNNYFYGEHFLCRNLGPSFRWLLAGCGVPPLLPFFIGTKFPVVSEGIFITAFEVASLESEGFILASLRNTDMQLENFPTCPSLQLPF